MSKHTREKQPAITSVFDSGRAAEDQSAAAGSAELDAVIKLKIQKEWKRRFLYPFAAFAVLFLIGTGVMAKNGWLPATDAMTGKKTGWFGKALPANAASSWNPMANPLPNPTPQLSKEYIYAGSRMLAIEDANAVAVPPTDLAVWRESSGTWYIKDSTTGNMVAAQFGSPNDKPVRGDFDADGKTDFCVYRPGANSIWHLLTSSANQYSATPLGSSTLTPSDIPAPADYDGDGKTDIAVFRPSDTKWYIIRSSDATLQVTQFGTSSDIPVPADYDGDGKADVAQFRPSTADWFLLKSGSNNAFYGNQFGAAGDTPVTGDYDGDGKYDFATWSSNNNWNVWQSGTNSFVTVSWGNTAYDTAVQGDYDGDGKTDIAVWRKSGSPIGRWEIRNSSTGLTRTDSWGTTGDIPVPAPYRR